MDAHYSRYYGCHQHLQWQWYPRNKQPHSNPSGQRTPIEMPYHWIGNSVPDPSPERVGFSICTANLMIQLTTQGRCIRQMVLQSLGGHGGRLQIKCLFTLYNNVVACVLLNFSKRIAEWNPEE